MNINGMLLELGFKSCHKGFKCIVDSVNEVINKPPATMQVVFANVAGNEKGAKQVERNIRHAMQMAWANTRFKKLEAAGIPLQVKPTVREFIHLLAMFVTKKI